MDVLHAPWRIEYILNPKRNTGKGSLFTQLSQAQNDTENYIITRSKHGFAVLNTYPYSGGHCLVAPYKQASDLSDLDDDENMDLIKLIQKIEKAIKSCMRPDGFNIGLNLGSAAGAGITEHLHWHIVPRWNGDTNFMPAIGQTSILPEALSETAEKIRAAIEE